MTYSNYISSLTGGPLIPGSGGAFTATGQPIQGPGLTWHGPTDVYSPTVQANQSSGEVLGAATVSEPAPTGPTPEEIARQQYEAQVRGDIESGYGSYEQQLDLMLNEGLPAQRTAQTGIAESAYQSGLSQLGFQKEMGMHDLETERTRVGKQQKRSLKDLSSNMRNMFQAGQVYLGARGAGDSSAANMYSYALTKLGSKRRGDVMGQHAEFQNQISDRAWKLGRIHDQETQNIKSTYDQQVLSIASWFSEAQNQLRLNKGQLAVSKGQDLANLSKTMLDSALNALGMAQAEAANRRSALDSWAMSNSSNLQQLKTNMQGVASYKAPNVNYQPISGNIQTQGGLFQNPAWGGGGYSTEEERV